MDKDELLLLGQISAKVDGVREHLGRQDDRLSDMDKKNDDRFNKIDERLRVVEQKAAVTGAVSGGAMSLGIALLVEGLRQWVSRGGIGH